ncbi:MAG: VTT domain-containing protein, partial [Flavobacteriales bacterium]|nr:VTT domain-containing protein [Flavobacteriales bacterium]
YLMVFFLGCLSYLGGVFSYFIGNGIGKLPKVDKWLKKKFVEHFDKIRKWGGVLIIFAALFPLPFSPICMVAGMVRFPLPAFFTLALFRFARFFGYALVLFHVF